MIHKDQSANNVIREFECAYKANSATNGFEQFYRKDQLNSLGFIHSDGSLKFTFSVMKEKYWLRLANIN